jgi:inorganic pyrophosphatase
VFKFVGHVSGQELLGAKAMAGLLMLSTITGILMALFFNTSGGAWDNSKKWRFSSSAVCFALGAAE